MITQKNIVENVAPVNVVNKKEFKQVVNELSNAVRAGEGQYQVNSGYNK